METPNSTISGEKIVTVSGTNTPSQGKAGLESQLPGQPTTVSEVALSTGDVGPGNLIEPDVDEQLYKFQSDDTPLMQLMLRAKKVNVTSAEVEHYMVDEPKSCVTTNAPIGSSTSPQAILPLDSAESQIPRPFQTLLCKGVDGYDSTGQNQTVGKELMLFVTGADPTTQNPIVRCVNGPKRDETDEVCSMPNIPAGTVCVILSNACHETQKNVDPDLIVPRPEYVYLQKKIMNQIVSDYWESQRKHITFTKALIAERAIANFKVRTNRTLWIGRKSKFKVEVPNMGTQLVYTSEGIRWQFKRELAHVGAWEYDDFVGLAKMFYTGEDVPKSAICLAGKNFLENIQKIDWSKHPEVKIEVKTNNLGWEVTNIHTVFGDLQFKREPTLDYIGYSNSAAILGENRLIHYVRANEHTFNEKVEGQEATRSGIILWDGLALKGGCHIWVDGEGDTINSVNSGTVVKMVMVDCTDISEITLTDGWVYYFKNACTLTDTITANAGDMYLYKDSTWSKYNGEIYM